MDPKSRSGIDFFGLSCAGKLPAPLILKKHPEISAVPWCEVRWFMTGTAPAHQVPGVWMMSASVKGVPQHQVLRLLCGGEVSVFETKVTEPQ